MCLKPQLRGIVWRKRGWYHELGVNFDTYIWGLKSIFLRGSNFWKNIEFKKSRVLLLQKGVMSHKCTKCYKIYANIKKNWELNPCVPWECSMYLKNLHNMQLPEHVLTKKKNMLFSPTLQVKTTLEVILRNENTEQYTAIYFCLHMVI